MFRPICTLVECYCGKHAIKSPSERSDREPQANTPARVLAEKLLAIGARTITGPGQEESDLKEAESLLQAEIEKAEERGRTDYRFIDIQTSIENAVKEAYLNAAKICGEHGQRVLEATLREKGGE